MVVKMERVEVYLGKEVGGMSYIGRLLGLITPDEFSALISKQGLAKKIETGESTSIGEVLDKLDDKLVHGDQVFRLVLDITDRGSKKGIYNRLLVTDVIEDVSTFPGTRSMTLLTREGWVTIEPKIG